MWTGETALTNVVMGCLKVLEAPTALKRTLMLRSEIGLSRLIDDALNFQQKLGVSAPVLLIAFLVTSLALVTLYSPAKKTRTTLPRGGRETACPAQLRL